MEAPEATGVEETSISEPVGVAGDGTKGNPEGEEVDGDEDAEVEGKVSNL